MGKKPKFIDKQELKRRIRDGNKLRKQRGELIDLSKGARPDPRGAHFTKAQRKEYTQLVDLAIYELANRQFLEWYHLVRRIVEIMTQANFRRTVVGNAIQSITEVATEASGLDSLPTEARTFLARMRSTVISVPGQAPKHSTSEADSNDSIYTPDSEPKKHNAHGQSSD